MNALKKHAWGFCFALCMSAAAQAGEPGTARFGLFGTLGYTGDDHSGLAPARDIAQKPDDQDATNATSELDSRLGAQVDWALSESVDLVGQVIWRDHYNATANSSTELAYVAIHPASDSTIRLGRINYDAFLMSDHRNVGYAYLWVRPPDEFYSWIPIFSVNGIDGRYDFGDEETRWRVKAQAGQAKLSIPIQSGYPFVADNLFSLSLTRQAGDLRIKIAHSRFKIGSEVPDLIPLQDGLGQIAAAAIPAVSNEAAALRKDVTFQNAKISYTTIGANFDNQDWILQAELGHSTATAAMVPQGKMGYLSVGRHLGPWTPFARWAISKADSDVQSAGSNWGAFNTLRDTAIGVSNETRIDQRTLSLGIRWDFHSQGALKLQWDQTRIDTLGYGLWWRDPALDLQSSSRVNRYSATIDFAY